ncbi:hypothetical protein [Desertimonas flava]|uniref:hypothetical protein n=1 Tax=Desertimonas flava TaxID=2064846 RepID=UPI0013C4B19F|nr:hypothetical protein [Desertimonas flava]
MVWPAAVVPGGAVVAVVELADVGGDDVGAAVVEGVGTATVVDVGLDVVGTAGEVVDAAALDVAAIGAVGGVGDGATGLAVEVRDTSGSAVGVDGGDVVDVAVAAASGVDDVDVVDVELDDGVEVVRGAVQTPGASGLHSGASTVGGAPDQTTDTGVMVDVVARAVGGVVILGAVVDADTPSASGVRLRPALRPANTLKMTATQTSATSRPVATLTILAGCSHPLSGSSSYSRGTVASQSSSGGMKSSGSGADDGSGGGHIRARPDQTSVHVSLRTHRCDVQTEVDRQAHLDR